MRKALSSKKLSEPNEKVDAVVGVLIQDDAYSDLNLLLIHRAVRSDDPWSGQMGLPGGRVEISDPSTKAALHREVLEEVGLDLDSEGVEIGRLSVSSPVRRLDFKVQPWVYGLRHHPEIMISPEVQDTFWVSLSRLPSLRTSTEIEIGGSRRTVDAFLVDGRVVWGFTHRVLDELLAVQEIAGN